MERILLRKNFDTDKFLRKGMNYFRVFAFNDYEH